MVAAGVGVAPTGSMGSLDLVPDGQAVAWRGAVGSGGRGVGGGVEGDRQCWTGTEGS